MYQLQCTSDTSRVYNLTLQCTNVEFFKVGPAVFAARATRKPVKIQRLGATPHARNYEAEYGGPHFHGKDQSEERQDA
jgi:hypothetical protein